ncbi:MAG: dihydroorotate dehydrogenase electron transfer subunit [Actinomycetota bacterium]|nr:dihydroorotate dehydrogenase electron transfer subunit [Actinomycetota bacterium]
MRTFAPLGRRGVMVDAGLDVGAYRLLHVNDPGGPAPAPGQFYMLTAAGRWGAGEDERPYLPRAFSYMTYADGRLAFMLEDVGPGTNRLAQLEAGDDLWLVGPLGEGFAEPSDDRRAILAGGGVGVPPLRALAGVLDDARVRVDALLGFRDAHHAAVAEPLFQGTSLQLASDDGSVGHHGFVTELLSAELDADAHAVVYACGPPAMLEAVRALCAAGGVPAQLALEAGMACGFGTCYGCVVPVRDGGYVRLCVDGPVLDADRLVRVPEDAH